MPLHTECETGGVGDRDRLDRAVIGPAFDEHQITDAIETIVDVYLQQRRTDERFIDTYQRLGPEPFKEKLYAPDQTR